MDLSSQAFLNRAVHDLKSPLRAIRNYSNWVREDCEGLLPSESSDHLVKIGARVERMERLISNLSLLLTMSDRTPKAVDLDVSAVVKDVAEEMRKTFPSIKFETERKSCMAAVDREMLTVILECLLSNAAKHREGEQGIVSVHCLNTPERVRITVVDDGEGIAPKHVESIFEPFEMLRSKDEVEGAGLGLTIVKKLVERLDGRIEIKSEPGVGSEVSVEF